MKPLLLVLLLCACGPAAPIVPDKGSVACVTDNGLFVLKPVPVGWCDEINAVEDRVYRALSTVGRYDERFKSSKERTRGWSIVVVDAEVWTDQSSGVPVVGQTSCDQRTVFVTNSRPASGALGHEIAHAVQMCMPMEPWDLSGDAQAFYHSNWGPIYEALEKAKFQ